MSGVSNYHQQHVGSPTLCHFVSIESKLFVKSKQIKVFFIFIGKYYFIVYNFIFLWFLSMGLNYVIFIEVLYMSLQIIAIT